MIVAAPKRMNGTAKQRELSFRTDEVAVLAGKRHVKQTDRLFGLGGRVACRERERERERERRFHAFSYECTIDLLRQARDKKFSLPRQARDNSDDKGAALFFGLFEPFIYKHEHFTKTGRLGTNIGKTPKKDHFLVNETIPHRRRPAHRQSPATNGIFEPFICKNDHFAKTGSGQT
jgi:hypothetical protein